MKLCIILMAPEGYIMGHANGMGMGHADGMEWALVVWGPMVIVWGLQRDTLYYRH